MKVNFLFLFCFVTAANSIAQDKRTGITISLPYINSYRYHDYEKGVEANKSGFGGIGMGVYYHYRRNKFTLNSGVTADLPAPIGPIDFGHEGTRHSVSSLFIDLLYHRPLYKKLYAVTGISNSWYNYRLLSYEDTIPSFKKRENAIGLTVGAEYKFRRSFSIAAFYRPSFKVSGNNQYRHLLTLDFRFDITVWEKN